MLEVTQLQPSKAYFFLERGGEEGFDLKTTTTTTMDHLIFWSLLFYFN